MKTFGPNLKKIRAQKKVSLRKLATKTGLSNPYLSQLETKDRTNPSMDVVVKIASALGVSISDLTK